jgi:hypothetical protein
MALDYVGRGWHLTPIAGVTQNGECTCGRSDCVKPGKHPLQRNWIQRASVDPETLHMWFGGHPELNVGIVPRDDLIIVDIDSPQATEGRFLPPSPAVRTSRGHHLYYRGIARKRNNLLPGLDIVANGGMVVAPPSHHHSGSTYAWADYLSPDDLRIAGPPKWLTDGLAVADEVEDSIFSSGAPLAVTRSRPIPPGHRNSTIYSMGCSLRSRGFEWDRVATTLERMNQALCKPPLSDTEVDWIVSSVRQQPRGPMRVNRRLDPRQITPGAVAYGLWLIRLGDVTDARIARAAGVAAGTVSKWRSQLEEGLPGIRDSLMDCCPDSYVRVPHSILEDPAIGNPERRELLWLCWLADDFGGVQVSHRKLGDSLGLRRATVSSHIRRLRSRRIITQRYGRFLGAEKGRRSSSYRVQGLV